MDDTILVGVDGATFQASETCSCRGRYPRPARRGGRVSLRGGWPRILVVLGVLASLLFAAGFGTGSGGIGGAGSLIALAYVVVLSIGLAREGRALGSALVLSVAVHGLAHAPQSIASLMSAVFTALVYGIPLALLFLRRGLECAIGYHFFIDFVRFGYVAVMWSVS